MYSGCNPSGSKRRSGERWGVWKKAVDCNKTEGKEAEGEQKGKTEKAKERKAPREDAASSLANLF